MGLVVNVTHLFSGERSLTVG